MELITRYRYRHAVSQSEKLTTQPDACQTFSQQHLFRAEDFIMTAAESGLFVNRANFDVFLQEFALSSMTLNHFEQKDYCVRYAGVADIEQLLALEHRCWASELWAEPAVLKNRLLNYPRGQFVLELNNIVVGVLYTQRIHCVEDIYQASGCSAEQQHDAQGQVMQLLSVFVDPDYQKFSYGAVLRDFALLIAKLTPNIQEVVAITRCQRYAENKKHYPDIIDYIYAVDESGLPLDSTLSFHVSGGASIAREIHNYRPKDIKNQGIGVLIRYDINAPLSLSKSIKEKSVDIINADTSLSAPPSLHGEIKTLIYSLIQRQMPEASMSEFHADTPFLLLGIDSLSLIQLRHLLNQALNLTLESDIFFRYPTAADLIQHLSTGPSIQKISPEPTISQSKKISMQFPIAITGLALRFPKANSSQEYWALLQQEHDAISRIPHDRWSQEIEAVPYGGFIKQIDYFDAEFFGISAAEAKQMDPQQRLLLEVTWHALESANIDPKSLKEKRVGVFIGQFSHDYELLQAQSKDPSVYYATGTSSSVSAGRLSYFLGSQGPTITLDTACSSSLVAVHLAQKSLQHGECDIAIVGGVNALLSPQLQINFTRSGMLAADGHCKAFDDKADGYVRSEGCGVVILQRLEEIQEKQHTILAIIRGSAVNHDGASNGLTAPNGLSQEALLKQALNDACLNADDIDYIEAHGTGTRLGDPIELNAIKTVFSTKNRKKPLIIGTAKTHIGHLEAAAGIAGLIKTVLSLQSQRIPKLLHFSTLNSQIELSEHLRLAVEEQEWKITEHHTRRAGISSFGFSGTNAHVIIEEAPKSELISENTQDNHVQLFVLSAKTTAALEALKNSYCTYLATTQHGLANIAYTSGIGRAHFDCRIAIIANNKQELIDQLTQGSVLLENEKSDLNQLARSYLAGAHIDWENYYAQQNSQYVKVDLPIYVFQQERYWLEALPSASMHQSSFSAANVTSPENILATLYKNECQEMDLGALVKGEGLIEKLALSYIVDFFLQVGWSYNVGDVFTLAEAQKVFSVEAIHGKLLQQLLRELEKKEILVQTQVCWRVIALLPTQEMIVLDRQNSLQMLEKLPVVTIEKQLLIRCGEKLASVLTGQQSPLELLFPQETTQSVSALAFYQYGARIRMGNTLLAQLVPRVITNTTPGVRLRFLEIGAGTGSTTRFILAALQQIDIDYEYTYTDISSVFFLSAKETFGEDRILYRKLNIEQDPTTQGFHSHCYDVIIASNALHATKNLPETLQHTRQLLAPHGHLLLLEIDQASRFLYLTFGLLEGWWRFDDALRTDNVLLTAPQWRAALATHDFEQITTCDNPAVVFAQANFKGKEYFVDAHLAAENFIFSLLYSNVWQVELAIPSKIKEVKNVLFLLDDKKQVETLLSGPTPQNIIITCLLPSGEYYTASGWKKITLEAVLKLAWSEIVYAWTLKHMPDHDWSVIEQRDLLQEVLAFMSALIKVCAEKNITLYVLTHGSQSVQVEDAINLCHAPLNGFVKTVLREYPHWKVSHIDLDPSHSATSQFSLVLHELQIADENQDLAIAYRQTQRKVSRLCCADHNNENNAELKISSNKSYLITGGLSGLGLVTAELLVQRGVRQLILASRRAVEQLDVKIQKQLTTWRDHGIDIRIEQVDISDETQVEALLRKIQIECLPLKGIIHSAGQLMDGSLPQQDWAHMEYVFKPKIYGAWYLHHWTQKLSIELEHFVMYSSIASVLGSAGAANYASANAFLDALAYQRQQQKLTAQTIHWGLWSDIGTAAIYNTTLEKMGLKRLSLPEGMAALEYVLRHPNVVETIVLSADWDKLRATSSRMKRFIHFFEQAKGHVQEMTWIPALKNQSQVQQYAMLEQMILGHVVAILDITKNEFYQQHFLDAGFTILGFDSLMIMELRYRIQRWLGETISLSSTMIFDYPSITELATYIYTCIEKRYPDLISQIKNTVMNKSDVEEEETKTTDAIAVIGLGCRFPGAAETVDKYWQLLQSGEDATTDVSHERIDMTKDYSSDHDVPGKTYTRRGAFVRQDIQGMDARFFNISSKEAEYLDPQQRLLMEVVWEALEGAGIAPHSLKYSDAGVFVGMAARDYADLIAQAAPAVGTSAYAASGTAFSTASGRLSFWLGCQGPSITIDTACSSSLVAVHQAIKSIETGECHLAIVGGVNLLLSVKGFINLSQAGMLSKDGRCKAFDDSADGFGRGEGCGVVILKRLSEAKADNDTILAIIQGSAINQDGPSSGLTVPNGPAQEQLLRMALDKAHLTSEDIDYIEAHGTGTSLGDPIEFNAIKNVFSSSTRTHPLIIGTAKTHINHLEAAAGIAGLIKTILSLQYQCIPKLLHFKQLNSNIEYDPSIHLPTENYVWERGAHHVRRAGVSSFGFSGTNAHVILEEAPAQTFKIINKPCFVISLSGKTAEALRQKQVDLLDWLNNAAHDQMPLNLISYTLNKGRSHFSHRAAWVVKNKESLKIELEQAIANKKSDQCFTGVIHKNKKPDDDAIYEEVLAGLIHKLQLHDVQNNKEYRKNLRALATLYVKGYSIDWELLHQGEPKQRISLPTYPFAKVRHWVPESSLTEISNKKITTQLHPLVHRNTSTMSLQRFVSVFDGQEFFFRHHVIAGNKLLPGVAYLEMARAAGEFSSEQAVVMLKDVVWIKPIQMDTQAEAVSIHLYPKGEAIEYEIILDDTSEIHSSGKLYFSTEKNILKSLDLSAIRSRLVHHKTSAEIYALFLEKGMDYGTCFQSIQTFDYSASEVLAELSLPQALIKENDAYYLHPSIMDAALQASMGLALGNESASFTVNVPFSLKTLQIIQPTVNATYAYVRAQDLTSAGQLLRADILLVDKSGHPVIAMEGFMAMPLNTILNKKVMKQPSLLYAHPVWWDQAIEHRKGQLPDVVISIGVEDHLAQTLKDTFTQTQFMSLPTITPLTADSIQDIFIKVFSLIKTLLSHSAKKTQTLLIVLPEQAACYSASLVGLMKTARLENSKLQSKVITYSEEMNNAVALKKLLQVESDSKIFADIEIYYPTAKQRQIKQYQEITFNTSVTESLIKSNGIYLITGGLGGLGQIFTRYMSATQGTVLILMGRSSLTKKKQKVLDQLKQVNVNVHYVQTDASELADVKHVIAQIKQQYGPLNGIIHSAGVIRDSLLVNKTESEINTVFAAKVSSALVLDEATQSEDLDFMLFFSSLAGVTGNLGQADYAGANAFLDSFANTRNQWVKAGKRRGKTIAIAWPLWKEGGMQVSVQTEQWLIRHFGLIPLSTGNGVQAFEQILNHAISSQVIVVSGDKTKLLKTFNGRKSFTQATPTIKILQSDVENELKTISADVLKLTVKDLDIDTEFQEYGVDSIAMMSILNRLELKYGKPLNPNGMIDHPTIRSLARYLIENNIASTIKKEAEAIDTRIPKKTTPTRQGFSRFATKQRQVGHQKVAIIALSCRLPGAQSLEAFWENLAAGKESIREVPADRWDKAAFYEATPGNPDKTYTNHGGFIEGIDYFDAGFFGISDKEALTLDPQHRLILELAAELWTRAGYKREEVSGSNTSVFIGGKDSSYLRNLYHHVPEGATQHIIVNSIGNMMAARVADFYNLTGSAKCIDTACSSSLVAIHEACQSILQGESEMAIAGGISLMIDPFLHIGFSQAKVLSADGKSYVFDERAQGFVLGEGAGLVLLKDYDAAIRDDDQIQAVILGSAVNNDGKTMGLTVPSLEGQKAVIEEALKRSQTSPESISYLEAHGTGTLLGDPIEIKAATDVYRHYTQEKQYCAVGSVKSNVGHTLMAAGVTSLLKVVLSLQHRQIPATLHCEKPHPRFGFETSPFYPNTVLKEWKESDTPRRAAISSFGFGGTNCHMILEESDQVGRRAALPLPSFYRKSYWLGREIMRQTKIDYADIIQQLEDGIISIEVFERMIEGTESE